MSVELPGAPPLPPDPRRRFGPGAAWTALFIGGLLLASVATPFIYAALLDLLPASRWPFSRIFNRTAMLIAAGLLFVLRRHFGWGSLRTLFGGRTAGTAAIELGSGLAAALLGVALSVGGAIALGLIGPATTPYDFFAARLLTVLVGGLAAAIIEESLFRGLMLTSLESTIGFRAAALVSSTAYALVHLLVSDPTLGRKGYSMVTGFTYLFHAVGRQLEPASVLPLVGLFLCGLVLAYVVRRTQSLYLIIGLHAGWAFGFQMLRHATRSLVEVPGNSYVAWHYYIVGTRWAWAGVLLSGALAFAAFALNGRQPAAARADHGLGS